MATAAPTPASGSSSVTTSGGTGPYTYARSWVSGGVGITLTDETSATVTATTDDGTAGTRSGVLRCTVTDTATSATAVVDINVKLKVV